MKQLTPAKHSVITPNALYTLTLTLQQPCTAAIHLILHMKKLRLVLELILQ